MDNRPGRSLRRCSRAGNGIEVAPADLPPLKATAENLPVEILYEDAAVIAINKPAGLVVHAGAGAHSGTLVNRLVHHFDTLSDLGGELRPGIVHRLDKDTSGVLLVARTDAAHRALAEQFAGRTLEKTYLALVEGAVAKDSGRIVKPIARDPVRRVRMTAKLETGRAALTDFRVLQRFAGFTYLEVRIGTGQNPPDRVHLQSHGYPVAGDRLYGAKAGPGKGCSCTPGGSGLRARQMGSRSGGSSPFRRSWRRMARTARLTRVY